MENVELCGFSADPFTKRHILVHNGGFRKFEELYCSQSTNTSIKIQKKP